MPALNGYGRSDDNATLINKAAEVFITSGLAKVLKINNICDADSLNDCGLPETFNDVTGTKQDLPEEIASLNAGITTIHNPNVVVKNTKAAAFETANGEAILLFYNPNCTAANVAFTYTDGAGNSGQQVKQHVCVNMIFDLNGKKGPNTVGKDMGIMSVMYSTDSKVVMPMYPRSIAGGKTHAAATQACAGLEQGEYRLPNAEELLSLYYNVNFTGNWLNGDVWTSTKVDSTHAYHMGSSYGNRYTTNVNSSSIGTICVKR